MSIASEIKYIKVDELNLDPKNPRLREEEHNLSQAELLEIMTTWSLEEIAASVVENGFWPHEAVMIVREKLASKDKDKATVVVEGNRRLAAVKLLRQAYLGKPNSPKWKELAKGLTRPDFDRLATLPTVLADERGDADAFLGFRHVTGIKQWEPHEKAAFIAKLIDSGLSYEVVMRRIGSKVPAVRQHYIAFKLFCQLEELEDVSAEKIRDKFSVLYLSLRSTGTQNYLGININASPKEAKKPLQAKFFPKAVRFSKWVFGDTKHPPLFTDSRHVDRFGLILANSDAVAYLERAEDPKFEVALRISGGDREEVIRRIEHAADEIEQVLSIVHFHSKNIDVIEAVKRLSTDMNALAVHFPQLSRSNAK
jgi:hypothetical protein